MLPVRNEVDAADNDDGGSSSLSDLHVKAFIDMTESLDTIRRMDGERGGEMNCDTDAYSSYVDGQCDFWANENTFARVTTHASVMYYGDRLVLSTETIRLTLSKKDYDMFCRVVKSFTNMVMGTYTNEEVQNLREDHDYLLRRWDSGNTKGGGGGEDDASRRRAAVSDEINKMIKNMLETPVYYTSGCMALISCGIMLRDLFRSTVKREAKDYADLIDFVRKHMRHNPVYPFECECGPEDMCSEAYKTLLSLILEIPPVVHNQTYMLQILAYLMYDKDGREEIFVVNMKNVVSPGLLDKVPTRLAMLVGSLDENVIKSRMKRLRYDNASLLLNIGSNNQIAASRHNRIPYNRVLLESLVTIVHDPRIGRLINALPGVENATVELLFERCKDKRVCLNADNKGDINKPKDNNYGKNKCCGYLKLDPVGMLTSSISALQLSVYLYADTRQAPARSQRHYFLRDILVAMAKCSMNMDDTCLHDIFGYLDRCDVFKGFAHNPIFTSTFYKLFQSYLKSMKSVANRYKTKRRKIDRILERIKENN